MMTDEFLSQGLNATAVQTGANRVLFSQHPLVPAAANSKHATEHANRPAPKLARVPRTLVFSAAPAPLLALGALGSDGPARTGQPIRIYPALTSGAAIEIKSVTMFPGSKCTKQPTSVGVKKAGDGVEQVGQASHRSSRRKNRQRGVAGAVGD